MLSEILSKEQNSEFAISMVDILNSILLTSCECFEIRNALKDFNTQVKLLICVFFFNNIKFFRKVYRYSSVYIKLGVIIQ